MLFMAAHLASSLPGWLQEPSWLRPLTRVIRLFILHHQAGGLFFVIFLEELGVPLPAPGDAAIAYGGYLNDDRLDPLSARVPGRDRRSGARERVQPHDLA